MLTKILNTTEEHNTGLNNTTILELKDHSSGFIASDSENNQGIYQYSLKNGQISLKPHSMNCHVASMLYIKEDDSLLYHDWTKQKVFLKYCVNRIRQIKLTNEFIVFGQIPYSKTIKTNEGHTYFFIWSDRDRITVVNNLANMAQFDYTGRFGHDAFIADYHPIGDDKLCVLWSTGDMEFCQIEGSRCRSIHCINTLSHYQMSDDCMAASSLAVCEKERFYVISVANKYENTRHSLLLYEMDAYGGLCLKTIQQFRNRDGRNSSLADSLVLSYHYSSEFPILFSSRLGSRSVDFHHLNNFSFSETDIRENFFSGDLSAVRSDTWSIFCLQSNGNLKILNIPAPHNRSTTSHHFTGSITENGLQATSQRLTRGILTEKTSFVNNSNTTRNLSTKRIYKRQSLLKPSINQPSRMENISQSYMKQSQRVLTPSRSSKFFYDEEKKQFMRSTTPLSNKKVITRRLPPQPHQIRRTSPLPQNLANAYNRQGSCTNLGLRPTDCYMKNSFNHQPYPNQRGDLYHPNPNHQNNMYQRSEKRSYLINKPNGSAIRVSNQKRNLEKSKVRIVYENADEQMPSQQTELDNKRYSERFDELFEQSKRKSPLDLEVQEVSAQSALFFNTPRYETKARMYMDQETNLKRRRSGINKKDPIMELMDKSHIKDEELPFYYKPEAEYKPWSIVPSKSPEGDHSTAQSSIKFPIIENLAVDQIVKVLPPSRPATVTNRTTNKSKELTDRQFMKSSRSKITKISQQGPRKTARSTSRKIKPNVFEISNDKVLDLSISKISSKPQTNIRSRGQTERSRSIVMPSRSNRSSRIEQPPNEKSRRTRRTEKTQRTERSRNTQRSQRPEKSKRTDRYQNTERSQRPERQRKTDRSRSKIGEEMSRSRSRSKLGEMSRSRSRLDESSVSRSKSNRKNKSQRMEKSGRETRRSKREDKSSRTQRSERRSRVAKEDTKSSRKSPRIDDAPSKAKKTSRTSKSSRRDTLVSKSKRSSRASKSSKKVKYSKIKEAIKNAIKIKTPFQIGISILPLTDHSGFILCENDKDTVCSYKLSEDYSNFTYEVISKKGSFFDSVYSKVSKKIYLVDSEDGNCLIMDPKDSSKKVLDKIKAPDLPNKTFRMTEDQETLVINDSNVLKFYTISKRKAKKTGLEIKIKKPSSKSKKKLEAIEDFWVGPESLIAVTSSGRMYLIFYDVESDAWEIFDQKDINKSNKDKKSRHQVTSMAVSKNGKYIALSTVLDNDEDCKLKQVFVYQKTKDDELAKVYDHDFGKQPPNSLYSYMNFDLDLDGKPILLAFQCGDSYFLDAYLLDKKQLKILCQQKKFHSTDFSAINIFNKKLFSLDFEGNMRIVDFSKVC